jgi:DNA-binding YbaB/EbfC family protein
VTSDTPPEGPNPFDLLASAQEALAAQAEAVNQTVEGTAGGGVVTVRMSGGGEVTGLTIAPEVVDPDDVEMLQDLIVAAIRDASTKATELQQRALGALGQIDIGALGGMLSGLPGAAGLPGSGLPGAGGTDTPTDTGTDTATDSPGAPGSPGGGRAGGPGGGPPETT